MTSVGGIEQRKRRATAGAFEELALSLPDGQCSLSRRELEGPKWRRFRAGGRLPPPTKFQFLLAEFPIAAAIWSSPTWQALDENQTSAAVVSKLYLASHTRPKERALEDVILRAAEAPLRAPLTLDDIAITIYALRAARDLKQVQLAGTVARKLFENLLMLSCDMPSAAAAHELYELLIFRLGTGLQLRTLVFSLEESVIDVLAEHARTVRFDISRQIMGHAVRAAPSGRLLQELLQPLVSDLMGADLDVRNRAATWLARRETMPPAKAPVGNQSTR
ncbi:MAG: hypothetical protein LKM32_03695 [Chiayiivirga sp.]|jgi:hypothetical protein|uniref:hypothetical protein n=1 Tax=Chiayiivirga sp. TaxID=2041042 RepID=UPI0025C37E5F|nr:hypothetical protein [Chiayiivirga sp.]MCI1728520.1 hypothetical protein [Chiayiivirga sp.]